MEHCHDPPQPDNGDSPQTPNGDFPQDGFKRCPDCTLPVLANEEFCVFCNHRLKVTGGAPVGYAVLSCPASNAPPATKTKKEGKNMPYLERLVKKARKDVGI
jgi:hypothetical protein